MKFHIVRNGETIDDIVFLYGLEADELKKENKHIRSWDNIIPGTKLRIPTIPEAVELDVISMEPFIEDYYPKLNLDEIKATAKEEAKEEYNYQEIDNYVIKSTENKNIQDGSDLKNSEATIEEKNAEVKEVKIPVSVKVKTTDEEDDEEEVIPIQPIYYPYYPYYYYNRYPYPKIIYPVFIYRGRAY